MMFLRWFLGLQSLPRDCLGYKLVKNCLNRRTGLRESLILFLVGEEGLLLLQLVLKDWIVLILNKYWIKITMKFCCCEHYYHLIRSIAFYD